ncbi:hypothetical protein OHA79_42080 [Streptomyces sp. NBC_00841]|uniref:hypothetical protein n=1 Tax=unclassified Streptomyces TaxID=2593676 RepID=UPI002251AE26|nr:MULTISPECIES: hypothetical protein [unclassified Streptomyces]MCX4530413.1 hypothetical protein [Streptomyces sp. NBC_01669]WSA04728.1 hypothetical protein OHA79_42080 [Streptomyces sp. NBC_00841]
MHQVGHCGNVIVAAEQRVGLVRDTAPDHGHIASQQLLIHMLERGTGVTAVQGVGDG